MREWLLSLWVDRHPEDFSTCGSYADPERLRRRFATSRFRPDLHGATIAFDRAQDLRAVGTENLEAKSVPLNERARLHLGNPALIDLPNKLNAQPVVLLLSGESAQVLEPFLIVGLVPCDCFGDVRPIDSDAGHLAVYLRLELTLRLGQRVVRQAPPVSVPLGNCYSQVVERGALVLKDVFHPSTKPTASGVVFERGVMKGSSHFKLFIGIPQEKVDVLGSTHGARLC